MQFFLRRMEYVFGGIYDEKARVQILFEMDKYRKRILSSKLHFFALDSTRMGHITQSSWGQRKSLHWELEGKIKIVFPFPFSGLRLD